MGNSDEEYRPTSCRDFSGADLVSSNECRRSKQFVLLTASGCLTILFQNGNNFSECVAQLLAGSKGPKGFGDRPGDMVSARQRSVPFTYSGIISKPTTWTSEFGKSQSLYTAIYSHPLSSRWRRVAQAPKTVAYSLSLLHRLIIR